MLHPPTQAAGPQYGLSPSQQTLLASITRLPGKLTPEGSLGQRLSCHVNAARGCIPPFLLNKVDGQIIPVLLGEPGSSISVEGTSSWTGFEDSLAALAVLRGGDHSRAAGHEDDSLHSSYQSVSGGPQSR